MDMLTIENRIVLYCLRKAIFWKYLIVFHGCNLLYILLGTAYCFGSLLPCAVTAFSAASMALYIKLWRWCIFSSACSLCGSGNLFDVWNGW